MNDRFYDYYDVLKVSFDASRDEIRGAFREASLRWHPDHNRDNEAGANEMMRLVNEAWDVLGNPEVRAEYDQAWMEWKSAAGGYSSHSEREEYRQPHHSWEGETSFFEGIRQTPIWVQILLWLLAIALIGGILVGVVWAVIEIAKLVVQFVTFIVDLVVGFVKFLVSLVVGIALVVGLLWLGYQMSSGDR